MAITAHPKTFDDTLEKLRFTIWMQDGGDGARNLLREKVYIQSEHTFEIKMDGVSQTPPQYEHDSDSHYLRAAAGADEDENGHPALTEAEQIGLQNVLKKIYDYGVAQSKWAGHAS